MPIWHYGHRRSPRYTLEYSLEFQGLGGIGLNREVKTDPYGSVAEW